MPVNDRELVGKKSLIGDVVLVEAPPLTATIARSRIDPLTGKVVERIVRSELVVVDDIGLLPAGADEAEALNRLVDAAYEERSLILTSNLHTRPASTRSSRRVWRRPRSTSCSTTPK